MSRIGKLPIPIPSGVVVTIGEDNTVGVKGPKGQLSQKIHRDITVTREGEALLVARTAETKEQRSMHGLYRTLISNMVTGVTAGFEKILLLEGVGYRAQVEGKKLTLNVGYSHPVIVEAPEGIEFISNTPARVAVRGIDKQRVGAVAADIRIARKAEPYHGKGIRYEGERIRRKEGKSGKKK